MARGAAAQFPPSGPAAASDASVRRLAHLAACSNHRWGGAGSAPCEMGGIISAAVVDALADWLDTSEAHRVVLDALTLADPAVHPGVAEQAAKACKALAHVFRETP